MNDAKRVWTADELAAIAKQEGIPTEGLFLSTIEGMAPMPRWAVVEAIRLLADARQSKKTYPPKDDE